jgi:hypothetical protein
MHPCSLKFKDKEKEEGGELYSRVSVAPVPDPLRLRKSGSARNQTQTSGSVARNSDHYTTEVVM